MKKKNEQGEKKPSAAPFDKLREHPYLSRFVSVRVVRGKILLAYILKKGVFCD